MTTYTSLYIYTYLHSIKFVCINMDHINICRAPQVIYTHKYKSVDENDLDPDEGNENLCHACTLPIFSTPYKRYRDYIFHECCWKIPEVLTDHPLHLKVPLQLYTLNRMVPFQFYKCNTASGCVICTQCKKMCNGSFYQCHQGSCGFTIDLICARLVVDILHRSHKHTLVPFRSRSALITCEACESVGNGEFYWCSLCDFYIHQSCALLHNNIRHEKHKQHSLTLTYHLPQDSLKKIKCVECSLCHGKLSKNSGVYICTRCDFAAHIKCAISEEHGGFEHVPIREAVGGLIHFPMMDEHKSAMQYMRMDNNGGSSNENNNEKNIVAIDNIHDHSLILHEDYLEGSSSSSSRYLCDACVEPISGPFYSCSECPDFYLHKCCANLPPFLHIPHPYCSGSSWTFMPKRRLSNVFPNRFFCHGCCKMSNGFAYQCNECQRILDLSCALMPEIITHEAHGKSHILFLSRGSFYNKYSTTYSLYNLYYGCGSCHNCKLDVRNALLPSTVEHKLDRHPLKLMYSSSSASISSLEDDDKFCEICEDGVDTQDSFYHCEKCVTLFHTRCIPRVGDRLSKFKFGGSVRVGCHSCPLTSFQLLTSYSYTCGLCNYTIEGRREGVALECKKCCYWLHVDCAERERFRDFNWSWISLDI
ncbi:uncharacterized protein LOC127253918 [Andrographis paniculata]|uniref:uncharacterized protein LOC127253918 n=1 Tax=Andrographis paniculata TaxID=175694 RepID=UPI0021E8E9D8|nr:uncharacterized protein LOC127253918 [Andrographis paniculata]